MGEFIVTAPDGTKYRVQGDTAEGAAKAVAQMAKPEPPKPLGRRIADNLIGDDDPTTQNLGERVGTALNMAGEAMTFGLVGDEASAAVSGAVNSRFFPNARTQEERLDHERQQQEILESEKPGLALGSQVAGGVVAPIAAATSIPIAAAIGAAGGATYGFMEGEDKADRVRSGAAGALFGGALGAAAIPAGRVLQWASKRGGKALRRLFADKRIFDGKTVTAEGREVLEAAGYNVDDLSDDFVREFAERAQSMPPEQAGRAASMAEFDIPVYRHNATGTVDDFAAFERGRRGALGPTVERSIREAGDSQDDAMRGAAERISRGMADDMPADQLDAAVAAREGLVTRRDAALSAAREGYDALEAAGGGVSGKRMAGVGSRIEQQVNQSGFRLSPNAHPNATGAVDELNQIFARGEKGSVPFMEIERGRQAINRYLRTARRGANEADATAVQRVLDAYDQEVDDIMTTALIDGSKEQIEGLAKNARGLWRDYAQTFTGKGATSRFIQKMIDEDASTDDMVKWLFSSGKLGTGRFNSTLAKGMKEVLGPDSGEWKMIQQAAFRQMWQKAEGTTQWGPQKISSNINEFLNSPATRNMAREIFTPEQIKTMRRYSAALKNMVPPEGSVNYSNTAYENARIAKQAFRMLTAGFGAASGGPIGAAVATGTKSAIDGGRNALAGRALLSSTGAVEGATHLAPGFGVVGGQVGPAVADVFTGADLTSE